MTHKSHLIDRLIRNYSNEEVVLLLESQLDEHRDSSFSYFTTKPASWIKTQQGITTIWNGVKLSQTHAAPWEALKAYRKSINRDIFGYFGYGLNQPEQSWLNTSIVMPDMFFYAPEIIIKIDNNASINVLRGKVDEYIFADRNTYEKDNFKLNFKKSVAKEKYLAQITELLANIKQEQALCVNLSHTLEFDFEGEPYHLYKEFRENEPVPFAAFLKINNQYICSASPERFLKKKGSTVVSSPIKGTLKRDLIPNKQAINEFLKSEKETNENKLTVDLICEELKGIALPGTVEVTESCELQSFKSLYHLVSAIKCEVDESQDPVDLIRANFPPASMVGVPRKQSAVLIDKLENKSRGVYAGAIGYINANADFDLNVVIRSAFIDENRLEYPVGGAITRLSVPENEWEETFVKSKAITGISNGSAVPINN